MTASTMALSISAPTQQRCSHGHRHHQQQRQPQPGRQQTSIPAAISGGFVMLRLFYHSNDGLINIDTEALTTTSAATMISLASTPKQRRLHRHQLQNDPLYRHEQRRRHRHNLNNHYGYIDIDSQAICYTGINNGTDTDDFKETSSIRAAVLLQPAPTTLRLFTLFLFIFGWQLASTHPV